jgi:hypothetical protein
MTMTFLEQQRLEVCRGCQNYREALGHGICTLIRDPSERVSSELFERAITRGVWPQTREQENPCLQPIQDFNGRRSDGR